MGTQTFSYTGADQTFTVPAGVTTVTVDDQGAEGGQSGLPGGVPGKGGRVVCDLVTTPGAMLHIFVGGHPTGAHPGSAAAGWPDGGAGCTANTAGDSGGGGGSSSVRDPALAVSDSDPFTRADSTTNPGSTVGSRAWNAARGTWGISSNALYTSAAESTGQGAILVADFGEADATISIDLPAFTVNQKQLGIVFRYVDLNNHWYWVKYRDLSGNPNYFLIKRVGGSETVVATGALASNAACTFSVELAGSSIVCKQDGVTKASTTDTDLLTATSHGFNIFNTITHVLDNFVFTGSATGLATRVVVAGGGGGQGGNNDTVGHGGDGGGGNGSTGSVGDGNGSTNPSGGIGATTSAGGAAGASGGTVGTAGTLAQGGAGGNVQRGGGGGGGGNYGGGGGVGGNNAGQSGGGGGGGSGLGTGVNQTLTSGYRSGNGQVILTWTVTHGDHVLLTDSSALLESDNTSVVLLNGDTAGSITVTAGTIHERVHVVPVTPAVSSPYRLTPGFIPIA